MERRHWILVGLIALAAVPVGAWYAGRPPEPPPVAVVGPPTPAASAGGTAATLTVHVTGEVKAPGLVTLPEGSRVADAVAAAGGLTARAALAQFNLAAPVRDGDLVVVPDGQHPVRVGASGAGSLVEINRATAEELATLPGIGPVTAGNIVKYRSEHGPFTVIEDLLDVPGIGEGKLAALRDQVAVP